ncbi:zinc finger CCCH domain-containing protein 14 [Pseudomyrmex gracilis]|uniref:zinc finger CCCH domain-containing protein 14 n=1 Tax=Pseudomyrmex gracilis TaxID=219809 RepID=UPI0009956FC9|nr:zinc finger CCCH domain-containing protein 14 [Pseudomyrmex gracilis]
MDTHGITNQLRSAIRAKLKELKVRYDEELPDYILVMVANKKTRQQMHDDLNLFLEDCTTEFVEWLHDQVLKKLQKVTVAKKKSRELVPMVVVKQEEERKKRKVSATSFLEDQTAEQATTERHSDKNKNEKQQQSGPKQQTSRSVSNQNSEHKNTEKNTKIIYDKYRTDETLQNRSDSVSSKKQNIAHDDNRMEIDEDVHEDSVAKITDLQHNQSETSGRSMKRSLDTSSAENRYDSAEKEDNAKRSKTSEEEKEDATLLSSSDASKKLKSCVNKPKITSVVSVKDRLGVASLRKKFDSYREKEDSGRYHTEKRFENSYHHDNNRNRNRNFEVDNRGSRRNRDNDHDEMNKITDARSRIESSKNERLSKNAEFREKSQSSSTKIDTTAKKSVCTIKNRLGVANVDTKMQKQPVKQQEPMDYRHNSKSFEQIGSSNSNSSKNIKNRLGPLKNNFKPVQNKKQSRSSDEYESPNFNTEEKMGEEDELNSHEELRTGPVKSHIVAINRSATEVRPGSVAKIEKKRPRMLDEVSSSTTQHFKSYLNKTKKETSSDLDKDVEDTKLPSKVIVAPRPLKPLQPLQKRATQSLLLRAVAEANQSVVAQKNPEPSLVGKKPILKPALARGVSQNLSILVGNSNKRLVMEKIQVELNTVDNQEAEDVEPEPYVPQAVNAVTDDHMGVVMSLFQRNDNNQKFLVTLNGYSNNPAKEKIAPEEDEERLEMEVNEDELALLTTQSETYVAATQSQIDSNALRITTDTTQDDVMITCPKETNGEENNENCNTENMDKTDEAPRRRRKLSPIVYNRSHSPSPAPLKPDTVSLVTLKNADKKLLVENTVPTLLDKSKEKCKYWPNCTSGNKCAYFHPMCSAFPACKFGDKCAYKHPKCKFGLSCTKLSCVFSHPTRDHAPQQCKYYPLCKKKGCPYFHPTTSIPTAEATSQRAKFTWRRQE